MHAHARLTRTLDTTLLAFCEVSSVAVVASMTLMWPSCPPPAISVSEASTSRSTSLARCRIEQPSAGRKAGVSITFWCSATARERGRTQGRVEANMPRAQVGAHRAHK